MSLFPPHPFKFTPPNTVLPVGGKTTFIVALRKRPPPDFENIGYLKSGSPVQKRGHNILSESKILYHLKAFSPMLTGTLPLDLFIEGKSDLDIICQAEDFSTVEKILRNHYEEQPNFSIERKDIRRMRSLICRFLFKDFPFEVFCQPVPSLQQLACKHLMIEYKLLDKYDETFRNEIIRLKNLGIKTEPAFAKMLGLTGDPYDALLTIEVNDAD